MSVALGTCAKLGSEAAPLASLALLMASQSLSSLRLLESLISPLVAVVVVVVMVGDEMVPLARITHARTRTHAHTHTHARAHRPAFSWSFSCFERTVLVFRSFLASRADTPEPLRLGAPGTSFTLLSLRMVPSVIDALADLPAGVMVLAGSCMVGRGGVPLRSRCAGEGVSRGRGARVVV